MRKWKNISVFAIVTAVLALSVSAATVQNHVKEASRLEKATFMALRTDKILDSLPKPAFQSWTLPSFWVREIAPYLEYERLVAHTGIPKFNWARNFGSDSFHQSGYTWCEVDIYLNDRYINPASPWFNSIDSLTTTVHEMIHIQGGDFCNMFSSVTTESSTQLGTLEVLAAMANHGNYTAFYALIDELRIISLSTVRYETIQSGDRQYYEDLKAKIFANDPIELVIRDKYSRYWANNQQLLKEILQKYSVLVFDRMQNPSWVLDLPLEESFSPIYKGNDVLHMDDLHYVFKNMETIAEYFGEENNGQPS